MHGCGCMLCHILIGNIKVRKRNLIKYYFLYDFLLLFIFNRTHELWNRSLLSSKSFWMGQSCPVSILVPVWRIISDNLWHRKNLCLKRIYWSFNATTYCNNLSSFYFFRNFKFSTNNICINSLIRNLFSKDQYS